MKIRSAGIASMVALLMFAHTCSAQAAPHQAVLTWGASPTPNSTYSVKRSTVSGGPYTTLKTGVAALTYTDSGLSSATNFCWIITATAPGFTESIPSNEKCGTTGQDQTASPGQLGVVVQ